MRRSVFSGRPCGYRSIGLSLLWIAGGFVAEVVPSSQAKGQETVTSQEISFVLPGTDWSEAGKGSGSCIRVLSPDRWTQFSIWPMDPYLAVRYLAPKAHAKAYFDMEKHQSRDPGAHWEEFIETEREIDGKQYPALTFAIRYDGTEQKFDGIMLICFTDDFAQRQRFYVAMWIDCHAPMEAATETEDLDTLIRSLSIGPYVSPASLTALTLDAANAETGTAISNPKKLARRFAKATKKKQSYRSEWALSDRSNPDLEAEDYVGLHWAMDYVAESRHHVMQKGWDPQGRRYVYDEWIDLAADHFDNIGIWTRLPDSEATLRRTEVSKSLRIDDLVDLLVSESPATVSLHSFHGRDYYAFTFELDPVSRLLSSPAHYSSLVDGPYAARIWVDASTGLIAKADIYGTSMKSDGKPAAMEIVRTFGQWGQDFYIEEPVIYSLPSSWEQRIIPPAPEIADQNGNLLRNAIFQGQDEWQVRHRSNVEDEFSVRGEENCIILERSDSQNDGGSVGLYQDLDVDVSGADRLLLSLDVCVASQTLDGSGWRTEERRGRGEMPARVSIVYLDEGGDEQVWDHGFTTISDSSRVYYITNPKTGQEEVKYPGVTEFRNATKINAAEWSHFSFDLLDENVRMDPWGDVVLPEPVTLIRISLYGNGWDFRAAIKNPILRAEQSSSK